MKTRVIINNSIVGILTKPISYAEKLPVVLLLHGFGTNKDEVGNTFVSVADKLCEHNIASLRIDFRGFGESKGNTSDLTIETLIEDANSALGYLMDLDFVDIDKIGICGFSLGAGVSILISNKQNNPIKAMALLSPAGDLPTDFREYFGFDNYDKLSQSDNELELDIGWRKIALKKQFIDSLKRHHLMGAITTYMDAFFVAAGANDFSCQHANNYAAKIKSSEKTVLIIDDCDHIFNAFNEKISAIPVVSTEVASWFKRVF